MQAEKFYACEVFPDPELEVLRYGAGGQYWYHNDSQLAEQVNAGKIIFRKPDGIKRDLTAVLYLSDDYTGGAIDFMFLGRRLRPQAGDLIMYPSSWQYMHGVSAIESGQRWALVHWFETSPNLTANYEEVNAPHVVAAFATDRLPK